VGKSDRQTDIRTLSRWSICFLSSACSSFAASPEGASSCRRHYYQPYHTHSVSQTQNNSKKQKSQRRDLDKEIKGGADLENLLAARALVVQHGLRELRRVYQPQSTVSRADSIQEVQPKSNDGVQHPQGELTEDSNTIRPDFKSRQTEDRTDLVEAELLRRAAVHLLLVRALADQPGHQTRDRTTDEHKVSEARTRRSASRQEQHKAKDMPPQNRFGWRCGMD
jgi:hypothetical protein